MGLPLEEELDRRGFTLGHFPSSILCSTVGGWIAARSAGQASGYYGKIEDMVLGLECVTGTGDVVNLHHRNNGPNLIPLVVGSEGTMAIVTSATLRLHPRPSARAFASWSLPFDGARVGSDALRVSGRSSPRRAATLRSFRRHARAPGRRQTRQARRLVAGRRRGSKVTHQGSGRPPSDACCADLER